MIALSARRALRPPLAVFVLMGGLLAACDDTAEDVSDALSPAEDVGEEDDGEDDD